MSEHKGTITLIIVGLIIFGLLVFFATDVVDPLLSRIGSGFTQMVDNVFSGTGMDWGGAGK